MHHKLIVFRFVIAMSLLAGGCSSYKPVSRNQWICFQNSACHELPDGSGWSAPVRGEIYSKSFLNRIEPEIIDFMEAHKFLTSGEEATIFEKRLAPFLDDHVNNMSVGVIVGGKTIPLMASDASGRIRGKLILSDEDVSSLSVARDEGGDKGGPRWMTLPIAKSCRDTRNHVWRVQAVPRHGLSVVSDIDDTIKITDVNNTKEMLKHTFMLPLQPVEGMAGVYQQWAREKGAVFHYLSESSIELCVPLTEFLLTAGYPEGSMNLREITWGHSRLKGMMSIMDAPPEYKIEALKGIIGDFPERDFVLVGDSSQHDPEVYSQTARDFPTHIRRILIHDVTCQGPEDPRYQKDFEGLPRELWQIFRHPEEIKDAIPDLGKRS